MGKRESDAEMKTQELKLRSERQSAEENRQAETQISFQSLLRSLRQREIWGAKLRRVSIVSVPGSHKHCFLGGVKP